MPRQNTSPTDFPPAVLQQIAAVAARIVAARKAQGATQVQWAAQLGISQPTMARLERGDPSVSAATYIMCLWLVNPQLDLTRLLPAAFDAADADAADAPASQPAATVQGESSRAPSPAAGGVEDFASLFASWAPGR